MVPASFDDDGRLSQPDLWRFVRSNCRGTLHPEIESRDSIKGETPVDFCRARRNEPDQGRSHRVRGRCGCPEAEFSVTRLLLQTARIRGSESRHLQHLIAEASPRPSEYPPLVLMTGLLDGGISLFGAAITADTQSPHPNISIFPYCQ